MSEFKCYRKKSVQEMRPYIDGEILPEYVSISQADKENGSPKAGDMIARNPNIPTDLWLIAEKFFHDNYEPVD